MTVTSAQSLEVSTGVQVVAGTVVAPLRIITGVQVVTGTVVPPLILITVVQVEVATVLAPLILTTGSQDVTGTHVVSGTHSVTMPHDVVKDVTHGWGGQMSHTVVVVTDVVVVQLVGHVTM